tara:strand:+ start:943 stop:1050 length:108 start_codon:yes stop_codon:yes gene_type:complete
MKQIDNKNILPPDINYNVKTAENAVKVNNLDMNYI